MQLRTLITLHAAAATKTPERLPPDVRAREALKLVDSGLSLNEVARRLGCNASSVMRWRNVREKYGEEAFNGP